MAEFGEVKDSGERQQWSTGSQRDSQEGKGRWDLIPRLPMLRLAQHYENGARKYDDDNWKKGQNLRQYINSAMRHLFALSEGQQDEDHAAAVAWNAFAFIWTKDAVDRGILPAELDDIPWEDEIPFDSLDKFEQALRIADTSDTGTIEIFEEPSDDVPRARDFIAEGLLPTGQGLEDVQEATNVLVDALRPFPAPNRSGAEFVRNYLGERGFKIVPIEGFHNPENDAPK